MSKSASIQYQNIEVQQSWWLLTVQKLKRLKQIAVKLASRYGIETFFILLHWNGKMLQDMQLIIKSVEHESIYSLFQ